MAKTAETAQKAQGNGNKAPKKTWTSLRKTFEEITGFWTREGILTGKILAKVQRKDGDFFVMKLTESGGNIKDRESGESMGSIDQVVGVPYSAVLNVLDDMCGKSAEVRLTPNGKKVNKKGTEYWDIQVEVSDDHPSDAVIS